MSNYAAFNAPHAVSFAFIVDSMKANIVVVLITGVRISVRSVKTILDYAVHGMLCYLYPLPLPKKHSAGHAGKHMYVGAVPR